MPVQAVTRGGLPGYRWGASGKVYTYPVGDRAAERRALRRAQQQGEAIGVTAAAPSDAVPTPPMLGVAVPVTREAEFARHLRRRVQAARLIARAELLPELRRRADDLRLDNQSAALLQILARMTRSWEVLFTLPASIPEQQLLLLDRTLSAGIRRQLVRAGVQNLAPPEPLAIDLYDRLTRDAQARFRGVGQSLGDDLARSILEGIDAGRSGREIGESIEERFSVAQGRAQFLARDLLGTGQAEITRARHLEAGVTEFRWLTARDGKVRPEHKLLEGQVYRYAEPPTEGLPGAPYGCRCTAVPVVGGAIPATALR